MDDVRHVDNRSSGGDVGRTLHAHDAACGNDARTSTTLVGEDTIAVRIQHNGRQCVVGEPFRIAIFDLDELGDCVPAVALHRSRNAMPRIEKLSADDQQPVVVTGKETLQHEGPLADARGCQRRPQLVLVAQIDIDRVASSTVDRLQNHRIADLAGGFHRRRNVPNGGELADRQHELGQCRQSQKLVLRVVARVRPIRC